MTKYRIMSYNRKYIVQMRQIFMWWTIKETFPYDDMPKYFDSIEEAREYIDELVEINRTPVFVEEYP